MKLISLAFMNFRQSLKSFGGLIVSLSFAIMMVFCFSNMAAGHAFGDPYSLSADRIRLLSDIVSVMLSFFAFVFIWYAMHTFLKARKKEFGTYIFMGFTPGKICRLYALEMGMTALVSIAAGLGVGVLLYQLLVRAILAISKLSLPADLSVYSSAVWRTVIVFGLFFVFFILCGMISIQRSTILRLMNASKEEEGSSRPVWLMILEALTGLLMLGTGFYLALADSANLFQELLLVVLLITFGVYLVFAGIIPIACRMLIADKHFLYKGVRSLYISRMSYRAERNYRTYALVSVLILSALTALMSGIAFRDRCEVIEKTDLQYNYQVFSAQNDLAGMLESVISEDQTLTSAGEISVKQDGDVLVIGQDDLAALAASHNLPWN